jgi:uncharacterized protein
MSPPNNSHIKAVFFFIALSLTQSVVLAQPPTTTRIVTGPETGTHIWLGEDLAKHVAPSASLRLNVAVSNGSVDNVRRLRDEKGTTLALVQSDAYGAFKDQADKGNTEAARLVAPLRVVAPLFDAELHFLVRRDSPLNFVHEIQNKKINIGVIGSGDAMTATALYQSMFGEPLNESRVTTLGHAQALASMARDAAIEVAVVVNGQPTALLLGLEPSVEKNFKLLKLDENHPSTQRALKTHASAVIKATSYPQWLTQDMATFAVKTMLITYDYKLPATQKMLSKFAKSLCENLPALQQHGHPKWRQVNLNLPPLPAGWQYYGPVEKELRQCTGPVVLEATTPTVKPEPACTLANKAIGLCSERKR